MCDVDETLFKAILLIFVGIHWKVPDPRPAYNVHLTHLESTWSPKLPNKGGDNPESPSRTYLKRCTECPYSVGSRDRLEFVAVAVLENTRKSLKLTLFLSS